LAIKIGETKVVVAAESSGKPAATPSGGATIGVASTGAAAAMPANFGAERDTSGSTGSGVGFGGGVVGAGSGPRGSSGQSRSEIGVPTASSRPDGVGLTRTGFGGAAESAGIGSASTRSTASGMTKSGEETGTFGSGPPGSDKSGTTTSADPMPVSTVVYEFDRTVYDTEISQKGFISANPEILALIPLTNLYRADAQTNLGILYDLQNSLRDTTVSRAQEIVDQFYSIDPVAQSQLAATRDANLQKYNALVGSLPKIAAQKNLLIATTDIASPSQDIQSQVDRNISTTDADYDAANGENYAKFPSEFSESAETISDAILPSSSTSGETFNLTVYYSDDDVTKYDGGKNAIESLSEKLIGDYKSEGTDTIPAQTKTARQYQLMKAALAQIVEGRNFDKESLSSYYTSPYESIEYTKIVPLTNFTSQNIEMSFGFPFAKATLEKIGDIVANNFLASRASLDETTYGTITSLQYYGINYRGYLRSSDTGLRLLNAEDSESDSINVTFLQSGDRTYNHLPTVSLYSDIDSNDFKNQILNVLATQITETSYGSFYNSGLPRSISPASSETVDISETMADSTRYVAQLSSGEKIFLFDESLEGALAQDQNPVSSVAIKGIDDIRTIKQEVDSIVSGLESFSTKNKAYISNQCAMTIISIAYKHIASFFESSALAQTDLDRDSATSYQKYSLLRSAMFCLAAHDIFSFGKLFSILHNENAMPRYLKNNNEGYGLAIYSYYLGNSTQDILEASATRTVSHEPKEGDFRITGPEQKEITIQTPDEWTSSDFAKNILSDGSSFDTFNNITNEILETYTSITSNSSLANQIKFFSYLLFLRILEKIKIYARVSFELPSGDAYVNCKIAWSPLDFAAICDCLNSAFTATTADEVNFTKFTEINGEPPTPEQIEQIRTIFSFIRAPIKNSLQSYQDLRTLIAYQTSVLQSQSSILSSIVSNYESLSAVYGGDTEKTALIASRYISLESNVDMLYKSSRYQTLIPGTRISSIATRSDYYRSIVKAVFKDRIPVKQDQKICIVGLPYGHLERLRLAKDDIRYYFNLSIRGDRVGSLEDSSTVIDYRDFNYYTNSSSGRTNEAGPYSVLIPGVYDDFDTESRPSSATDDSIVIYQISEDGSNLSLISRSEADSLYKNIDFPATIIQAALQSYVEDIYGIYPSFATTKGQTLESFPEESYADAALVAAGIQNTTTDERLVYERLKSMIMMHQDFITTRMVDEIEASPLFDKIMYLLVDGGSLPDIITEIFTKVDY
jgi:hypothetical protein